MERYYDNYDCWEKSYSQSPNFLGIDPNGEPIYIGDYCLLPGHYPDEREIYLDSNPKLNNCFLKPCTEYQWLEQSSEDLPF